MLWWLPVPRTQPARSAISATVATSLTPPGSPEWGHLIYLTVAGADRATGVPVMDSKHEVERYLRHSGVPHTIIAPVYFMENLWNPWNTPVLASGRLPSPVSRSKPLQQIPIADVLAFTVHVLQSREEMLGKRIEIASDDPPADSTNPLFAWLERVGTHVDITALQHEYPQVEWHTFTDWTRTQDWSPLHANNAHPERGPTDVEA
jgi:NmrA-like family